MGLIFVDCEAPFGVGSPAVGDMTEFGAVEYKSRRSFHGLGCDRATFEEFAAWISQVSAGRPVFVSDNPAYDWQWINFYFWRHLGRNPFGHSARRIGDFYAGLCGDFYASSNRWKSLRVTPHDHNPVHDAMGNAEAFERMLRGERA
jgi:hypothetical protein